MPGKAVFATALLLFVAGTSTWAAPTDYVSSDPIGPSLDAGLAGASSGDYEVAISTSVHPYKLKELLGSYGSNPAAYATDINDAGQISGYDNSLVPQALRWPKSGGTPEIVGTLWTGAVAINAPGEVAGFWYSTNFYWSGSTVGGGWGGGGGLPGGNGRSSASDLNDFGDIVGSSGAATGTRAYLAINGGGTLDLGDLPGGIDDSSAGAINNLMQVVGASSATDGQHAFLWTPTDGMTDLGTLLGSAGNSRALDINSKSQVVGSSSTATVDHAFLWTSDGGMQDLGSLAADASSRAVAINNHGNVIGDSNGSVFIWTPSGGMQDLHTLLDSTGTGWTLLAVGGINNYNQIVGYGLNPDGDQRAFLLTPVPEPSTIVLAVIGAAGLIAFGYRKRSANRNR